MKAIRKTLIVLLLVVFVAELATVSFLNVSYSANLPRVPDEKPGRIYQMVANRFTVYGTKQEFKHLSVAERFFPLAAVCGLFAGILNFKYGDFPPLKPLPKKLKL